jgi:hypothetical protein
MCFCQYVVQALSWTRNLCGQDFSRASVAALFCSRRLAGLLSASGTSGSICASLGQVMFDPAIEDGEVRRQLLQPPQWQLAAYVAARYWEWMREFGASPTWSLVRSLIESKRNRSTLLFTDYMAVGGRVV